MKNSFKKMKNYLHVVSFVIAINVASYSIGSSNWFFGESGERQKERERAREGQGVREGWGRLGQLEL